ncbi:MAG: serine/threonine-protein kinase [Planctomycetota bacterium]
MPAFEHATGDRPLDGYTIQHALGRGGFGEVYYAESDAGRQVALKAIQCHEEVELRGIGQCMNLKSPHLVMIFDVRRDESGTPWAIMEFVDGPSLRDLLDEADGRGLGEQKSAFLTREIARGLSELHESGVVHRDLKPENIFIERGVVKIGDYSLSKSVMLSQGSQHTTTVGSVHYMAPEIGDGRYDTSVDIYSLGVILHEMMTGRTPFRGESVGEILMKHLRGDLHLDGLPANFARCIRKAMQRDPEARYATVDALVEDLLSDEQLSDLAASFRPRSLSMVGTSKKPVTPKAALEETHVTPTPLKRTDRRWNETPSPSWIESLFKRARVPNVRGYLELDQLRMAAVWMMLICFPILTVIYWTVHASRSGDSPLALSATIVVTAWIVGLTYRVLSATRVHNLLESKYVGFIVRRLFSLGGLAFATVLHLFLNWNVDDEIFVVPLISLIVIDWMRTTHPKRPKRFDIFRLMAAGLIAAFMSSMVHNDVDHLVFETASVMLAMMSLQAFAPMVSDYESPDPEAV